jgi:hypothetical protein
VCAKLPLAATTTGVRRNGFAQQALQINLHASKHFSQTFSRCRLLACMNRLDVVVHGPVPSSAGGTGTDYAPHDAHLWLGQPQPVTPTVPCQVALWIYTDRESGRPMLHAISRAHVHIQVVGEFGDTALVLIRAESDAATDHHHQTATISLPSSLTRATPVAIAAHSITLRVCQLPFADMTRLKCSAHNGASLFLGTEPLVVGALDMVAAGPGPSGVHVEAHPLGATQVANCTVRADDMCTVIGSGAFVNGVLDMRTVSPQAVVSLPARRLLGSSASRPALVPPRPADPATACVVCLDRVAQCTLPNCGHCVLCVQCVARLHRMSFRCPVCRHYAPFAVAPSAVFSYVEASAS